MSFKPGEMAEQGHRKRNNGEKASRIESGNAQATRKEKKWRNGRLVAGQAGPLFFFAPLRRQGQVAGFLAFSEEAENRQVSYQLRIFCVCGNSYAAFDAQVIHSSTGRRFSATRLSSIKCTGEQQDAPNSPPDTQITCNLFAPTWRIQICTKKCIIIMAPKSCIIIIMQIYTKPSTRHLNCVRAWTNNTSPNPP